MPFWNNKRKINCISLIFLNFAPDLYIRNIMDSDKPIYQRDVLEFVTVAVQYCAFLEGIEGKQRSEVLDIMSKLMPLLYLKGTLLPRYELLDDEEAMPADYVTEENYDIIRCNIASIMADRDDYLDVFVEDMKYSDTPVLATISENLADIYQELKNFAYVYKLGVEADMMTAVAVVKMNFEDEWGQKAANVLRAIHEVKYDEDDLREI